MRKDGSRFWANVVIDAIRDRDGELIGFAKVTRDLTERVGAQSRAARERGALSHAGAGRHRLRDLHARSGRPHHELELGGERIKGYPADEIVGQHFSHLLHRRKTAPGEPERELETAAREGRYEGEGWRVRKDGTRFWAGVVIDRILDQDGKLLGFAKITRDMTEKKKAEEELNRARAALAQAQKMEAIGQLTGGVAHDFNNLLTVITNSLDLLVDPRRDEAQKTPDHRHRAARRRTRRQAEPAAARLFAAPAAAPGAARHQRADRRVRGRAAARLPGGDRIRSGAGADAGGGRRSTPSNSRPRCLNLVVNARDAMPDGRQLRIATRPETIDEARARAMSDIAPGDYVKVSVSDTGEGMTAEVVRRAFEPFFTTKEVGKGSGLGLSQVYGFVAQSGGHVAIDSAPGAGTTVTLYPARDRSASRPATRRIPKRRRARRRPKILVVEDDPDVLDVAVESLRMLGYDVLTAPDGPSALAVLRRDADIEILLSDIVMPHGMNGVELAREAVRLRPDLRVLLASGYPMTALPRDNGAAALDEFPFLSKPYRSSQLAEALRAL